MCSDQASPRPRGWGRPLPALSPVSVPRLQLTTAAWVTVAGGTFFAVTQFRKCGLPSPLTPIFGLHPPCGS